MRGWTGIFLLNVASLVFCAGALELRAAPRKDLFSNPTIPRFNIELSAPEFEKLKRDNRTYVSATITVDDQVFKEVAVRLKGQGSFRPLNDKPSFAVKFDGFTPEQKFHGLSKIMLNNATQDSTLLSEYLATSLFRDAEVPAARVTHARVTLNGRELGFYVLIEAMNKTFLKRAFANANGNLYEGYAKDIDQKLEHDGGPPSDQSDLRALVAAARLPAGNPMTRLSQVLDVDRFFSFLAVTMLVAQHDSYPLNRNNYRIYHDPTSDRFVMIPHGIDGTFKENNLSIRPPAKYLLPKALLDHPAGRQFYRDRVANLFTNIFRIDVMTNRVYAAVQRLQAAALDEAERVRIAKGAESFVRRVTLRHRRVAEQLGQPEPPRISVDPAEGVLLTGWEPDVDAGVAILEKRSVERRSALYIRTGESTEGARGATRPAPDSISQGAWRMRAVLDPGRYQITGRLKTLNDSPARDGSAAAHGAAIRTFKMYSSVKRNFSNGMWTDLLYRFTVSPGEEEVEFICELRATSAEAWFDAESLKLIRE